MGIGLSNGAFYNDEAHYHASQWDDRYDDNVITPNQMYTNKGLEKSEIDNLGLDVSLTVDGAKPPVSAESNVDPAIEEELKSFTPPELRNPDAPGPLNSNTNVASSKMPFPDNKDPRQDFDYRFPKDLPPSGILNDLKKPTGQTVPLVRKISDLSEGN